MNPRWRNAFVLGAGLLLAARGAAADATPALSADDLQFFETKIRPLLSENCYQCHSHTAKKIKAGLVLDSRDGVLHGGSTGPALVPGKPDDSLLIQAIRYTDADLKMPPDDHGGKLNDQQIATLTEWVRRGAPDPRVTTAVADGQGYGATSKNHWSFLPVKKNPSPSPPMPVGRNRRSTSSSSRTSSPPGSRQARWPTSAR